jgi:hypothetical protein
MPVVDFDGVQGGGFDPLPRGTYHGLLTGWETRQTSENAKHPDKDYYSLEFTIQSGPYENRKLWTNAMLPPEYTPFVLKQLVDSAPTGPGKDEDIEDWLDKQEGELEVNLVVAVKKATKEYEAGNKINQIKSFDESGLKGGGGEGGEKVSSGFMP